MDRKHKWIILASELGGKKYALDKLAREYENIPDNDPRLSTPSARALLESLVSPPVPEVRLICYPDSDYPEKLRNLTEPPAQLYVRGDIAALSGGIIAAVVGSREASAYGLGVTMDFCRDFCEAGITVISGGARGIDSAAAETMLKFGGRTVAVLGSGVDVSYPSENRRLFDKIAASGGAVVSEYHFGTKPMPALFPKRNRIIAALADCCVVTEAGLRSGSLITANLAADLRKPIFAVPGNITSHGSTGTNHLIKTGASLAESGMQIAADMRVRLSFSAPHGAKAHEPVGERRPKFTRFVASPEPASPAAEKVAEPASEPKPAKPASAGLDKVESSVIAAIEAGRTSAAEIADAAGLDELTLSPTLITMELKGLISRDYGGYAVVR